MIYLYSVANILILLSLSFTQVIIIRSIFVLAEILFITYGLLSHMYPMVFWATASLSINLTQIAILIKDMIPRELSYELKQIKDLYFDSMRTGDFLKLIKLSKKEQVMNKKILRQGETVKNLLLITKGEVYINREGAIHKLGAYHFIGEMSYFNEGKANATIYTEEPVEYLCWRYTDLRCLQEKKLCLFIKMIEAMGKDIMLKMLKQSEINQTSNPS